MWSMTGECTGKVRSTPTPKLSLRTVKVSRMPPPWRAMTSPSKTWMRLRVPSTTLTCTLRRSPGRKSGTSSRSWRRSMTSRRSIVVLPREAQHATVVAAGLTSDHGRAGCGPGRRWAEGTASPAGRSTRGSALRSDPVPAGPGGPDGCVRAPVRPPGRDAPWSPDRRTSGTVVAAELDRPGVVRMLEQALLERLRGRPTRRSRARPGAGARPPRRSPPPRPPRPSARSRRARPRRSRRARGPARRCPRSDRRGGRAAPPRRARARAPASSGRPRGVSSTVRGRGPPATCCGGAGRPRRHVVPDRLGRGDEHVGAHHHAGTAAVGRVVDAAVPVGRPVTQVVHADVDRALLAAPSRRATCRAARRSTRGRWSAGRSSRLLLPRRVATSDAMSSSPSGRSAATRCSPSASSTASTSSSAAGSSHVRPSGATTSSRSYPATAGISTSAVTVPSRTPSPSRTRTPTSSDAR
jgi:hypothetical protein